MLSITGLHNGGAERIIASLCDHLDKTRFSVTVCWAQANGEIGEELVAKGVDLIGLPELKPEVSPYMRFKLLKNLCKERSVDVIHTHDTGTLADAAQARMTGSRSKIVHTFHFGNYPHLVRKYLAMEMLFSRCAHRLVAVGHEQAKLVQKSLRLRRSRLTTIYNGVEHVVPEPGFELGTGDHAEESAPVILGSVSTLTRQKGLPVLLEAAALLSQEHKNYVLVIAGGGPMLPELKQQAESLGIAGNVRFLDWVPNAAGRVLHCFDVFCQSSLWEANSIVLLEAMSAGLPIVTTNVGESQHVITDGTDGRVVPPDDPRCLADAIAALIDDSSRRRAMGRSAQTRFQQNYTVDKMVEAYESTYLELAGPKA